MLRSLACDDTLQGLRRSMSSAVLQKVPYPFQPEEVISVLFSLSNCKSEYLDIAISVPFFWFRALVRD